MSKIINGVASEYDMPTSNVETLGRWQDPTIEQLQQENQQLKEVIEEVREYINSYDVFKEFSFPLMKREEENQTKSSIKYEFDTSIKKELLQILDKAKENK